MKLNILLIMFIGFTAMSTSCAYNGWEKVWINADRPTDLNCKLVGQEGCPAFPIEGCYNWYKKRATTYGATQIYIDNNLAEYYACKYTEVYL